MELVLNEWLATLLRWLHVVAAMAWIGSSFYFMHLDHSLRREPDLPDGVKGAAWQVHGGGFYHIVKYLVAPSRLPDHLTWFKWEAYSTWLSGFFLLVVVYYFQAELFLIDKSVLDVSASTAAIVAFGTLLGAWLTYEVMCRSPLGKHEVALALIGYVFLVGVTYGFTHVFSGRGALTQIGALIGTIMVANVFVAIIPNQRKIVAALLSGKEADPRWGAIGKQRSVHNNYLTLPVVFLMLSSHWPLVYATDYNWAIVAVVLLIGPAIRHFYNTRHAGKGDPWWAWGIAAAGVVIIVWLSFAGSRDIRSRAGATPVQFAQVEYTVLTRCSMCHAKEPVWAGIDVAPKGVRLDEPDLIHVHARQIALQAAVTRAMPPGNITDITEEERNLLAAWLEAGAPRN